ncbi:MAG: DUF2062 domain-containing protein [Polyangiaceae bacterium]|nr:DUF2062 domain-containing protein [Polyangiaceae bacterium]
MRVWIRDLVKVKDTPEALARGLAVGFFFGTSFFWGLQIALAVLVSYLVRGNKVVAAAMTAVSNPLTSLPLYSLCYFVGHLVVGGRDTRPDFSVVHSVQGFVALGPHFFTTMLVGTTLVGLVGAVVVYFSSNRLLAALRRWHARRTGGHEASETHEVDDAPRPGSQRDSAAPRP